MSAEAREMIRFPCPGCQAGLKASKAAAGKELACPRCQRATTVPHPLPKSPATQPIATAEVDQDAPMRLLPTWAWFVGGVMTLGMTSSVVLLIALFLNRAPSTTSNTGDEAEKPQRRIFYNFSPFLPQGVTITDLKVDGPFLTGRIRSARFPLEADQIRVTFTNDKHAKVDEVTAMYPNLRAGETGEISVLCYQMDRVASVSFDPAGP